ncbi:hypothetical protein CEXT_414311 [Caerostris extrusa]|uniref:Uncharacterized protein n=1 Tax=Caerostris extrusa TaxID=172846 RepID=A0AAV4QQB7_CAEEX|nr:hypothetical protein CEXT_414311 [Caerostris extrusa]
MHKIRSPVTKLLRPKVMCAAINQERSDPLVNATRNKRSDNDVGVIDLTEMILQQRQPPLYCTLYFAPQYATKRCSNMDVLAD